MHIGREVTAKQYTGGEGQDSKGTYIKKQAQEWVRLLPSDTADIPAGGMPITMESMTTVSKGLFMLPLYGNLRVCGVVNTCG